MDASDAHAERNAPLAMSPEDFRAAGRRLVDTIAAFLEGIGEKPVTPGSPPETVREILGDGPLPDHGVPAEAILGEVTPLLLDHSLLSGHPRFWGYIIGSPSPLGALGDLLAGAVNPNVGAWILSPVATEIELQTVRWIAELVGYPTPCGGLLVSGGNMANFVGFLAARRAKAPWDVRAEGLAAAPGPLAVYVSRETHTWIQKAADLFGLGTNAIRWISTDANGAMDPEALERTIAADRAEGRLGFLVVGTAGSVSTGAIDPLPEIAVICQRYGLWFHVDGAYGAPAAALPESPPALRALDQADSVALDPHKWLYAPLEAGCTLVRDPQHLIDTFSFRPEYYNFSGPASRAPINYFELGLQNSRGFRALKVWLGLRQAGREGFIRMIREDIALAGALRRAVEAHPEMEGGPGGLSIATFRYVPGKLEVSGEEREKRLNALNQELLNRLQGEGEVFVSNAVVSGRLFLRACFVNFRSTARDVEALLDVVARVGHECHEASLRPAP